LAIKVDALDFAIEGFLEQEEENHNWRPLAFFQNSVPHTIIIVHMTENFSQYT